MAPLAQLQAFAQSVHLVIKNRYYDDLTSEDGLLYLLQVVDWCNQFIDELEGELDAEGFPVNWNWARQLGFDLGTAAIGDSAISLPSSINNLVAAEERSVQILQDGTPVSNWTVVQPDQMSTNSSRNKENLVTSAGGQLLFSRPFNDTEDQGDIVGDVTTPLPRMAATMNPSGTALAVTNMKILTTVKPKQLLVLGVAKNATLPDIVRGGLSPSYVQKFNDLLQGAIARNAISSRAKTAQYDDFSGIGGVGI